MPAPMVARKTTTTIQDGSRYKERWPLTSALPEGTTVRQVFLDSAGGQVAEITGVIDGRYAVFDVPYSEVEFVPNAAGFYTYLHLPDRAADDEDMLRYGTTFRRQLTFPNSPSVAAATVMRQFEDDFQRPAGPVGGRWKVLVGQPRIFDNPAPRPKTVGPQYDFFSRYFMRFYQPFNDDTVDISFQAIDKGDAQTVIAWACNSQATSYMYLKLDSWNNKASMGVGHSPDLGLSLFPSNQLEDQITPVNLTISGTVAQTFKLSFDDTTREFALYNADRTQKIVHWVDDDSLVPTGKGYRYFAIGGNSQIFNSGVQLANIKAASRV